MDGLIVILIIVGILFIIGHFLPDDPFAKKSIYKEWKEKREVAKLLNEAGLTEADLEAAPSIMKTEIGKLSYQKSLLKIAGFTDEEVAEQLGLILKDGEFFIDDGYDEVVEFDDDSKSESQPEVDSNTKALMAKMISCVINYPSIVNDPESSVIIEERARKLPKSDVLVELIRFSQVEADPTKEALLMPYKAKPRIYSRLEELSVLEPFLSEYEAKEEFSYALTAAEKYYERKSIKASISTEKGKELQKIVMEKIMKSKVNSNSKK